jgi:hypothetical protein
MKISGADGLFLICRRMPKVQLGDSIGLYSEVEARRIVDPAAKAVAVDDQVGVPPRWNRRPCD